MDAGITNARPILSDRAGLGLSLVGAVVVAFAVVTIGSGAGYIPATDTLGTDYVAYRDSALRFLTGDGFYLPRQLAGPWTFETFREPLYPPSSLALFVPFAFLPAVLWWIIPAGVIGYAVRVHRPHPLALAVIVVALLSRTSIYAWWVGNPGIWLAAAIAAATVWGTGPLVLLKPSFAPLALIGIGRPGWWRSALVMGVVMLVTAPMLPDYFTVLRNAPGVGYSVLSDIPVVAVPLVAWLGATLREPDPVEDGLDIGGSVLGIDEQTSRPDSEAGVAVGDERVPEDAVVADLVRDVGR